MVSMSWCKRTIGEGTKKLSEVLASATTNEHADYSFVVDLDTNAHVECDMMVRLEKCIMEFLKQVLIIR